MCQEPYSSMSFSWRRTKVQIPPPPLFVSQKKKKWFIFAKASDLDWGTTVNSNALSVPFTRFIIILKKKLLTFANYFLKFQIELQKST